MPRYFGSVQLQQYLELRLNFLAQDSCSQATTPQNHANFRQLQHQSQTGFLFPEPVFSQEFAFE